VEQLRKLIEKTRTAESYKGITGKERVLIYRLACESGLRANEIRTLLVSDFDFKANSVTVRTKTAKNRKQATLPLKVETSEAIKKHLAFKTPQSRAFKSLFNAERRFEKGGYSVQR
jgi:integrase